MKKIVACITFAVAAFAVAGCGKSGKEDARTSGPVKVPAALAGIFADVPAQDGLLPIPKLRGQARPGDTVVLEAKVMGTEKPFVNNRALFVVGDEGTLVSCDIRHKDSCPTPWDNCCDDPEVVRAGTATIQVVGADGNVLRHGIKGVSGLKELSRLRIAGVVAPSSTEAALIINASRIQLL